MPDIDLLALLRGQVDVMESDLDTQRTAAPVYGVTLGIVTDIDDTKNLGRVKLRFPWLSNRVESAWARIAVPWGGQRRGSYLLPEVDDEVLVAFRHGDLGYPYVLGFVWSEKDPPPEETPRLNRRELRSKRDSRLVFDDTQGRESVTMRTRNGFQVTVDEGAKQVRISESTSQLEIKVTSGREGQPGAISIKADSGDIRLSASTGKVSIEGSSVDVKATGQLLLKGSTVQINPPGGGVDAGAPGML
jgi:uncharacterized protein involved in type VI secretion and phage assembly